jgi:5-methyltetrahydrofolate--homocysteine methyltransferase
MSDVLSQLKQKIIDGDMAATPGLTRQALDEGMDAARILNEGLMPGMEHVGIEFGAGNLFVPEVLRAARAMQAAMDILRPLLVETGAKMAGKIVIGTVKGDLHDIGKNLVAMMCEGAGFEVNDLGRDVDPAKFVEASRDGGADIVAMSALLTTTMMSMQRTIQALGEAGLREQVKVIIGGAPVTQEFADKIGADGYAANAAAAANLAKTLVAALRA